MRLAVCTLSAVLLSGCSWLGGVGNVFNGGGQGHHAKSSQYNYGAGQNVRSQHGQHQYQAQGNPCQVYSAQAPIPQGCHPSQVTLGTAGGFPQQPSFGAPAQARGQYASQGYGSHAGVAHQQAAHYNPRKNRLRKPRFRGSLSLGVEKSISGDLLNFDKAGVSDPVASYNPQSYNEGRTEGTPADDLVTEFLWTANQQFDSSGVTLADITTPNQYERANKPSISFDDVHSTPARIALGGEYILNPKTTVFANAGYTHAEGNSGEVASIDATLYEYSSAQVYDDNVAVGAPTVNIGYLPNQRIARFSYNFSDMERYDLEAGARHYLNPIVKTQGHKTITPFLGASIGASHYNGVSFVATQEQLEYEGAFTSGGDDADFYTVTTNNDPVDFYDSQWVPSGQLNAGMEWQVTPKTALAFETGVRLEGARKYSNGERGDKNIAIPMTIRGSYNF